MSPWGVTTDGHGHLFICDMRNECIQVFTVSDGKYQGCLLKKGQKGMGVPRCIRWFHENSSLVVAHKEADKRNISVIRIESSTIQTKSSPEKQKSSSKSETTEKKETSPQVEKPCSEQKKSTKGKKQKTSKKEKSSSEKQKSTAQEKKSSSEEQKQTPEETNL